MTFIKVCFQGIIFYLIEQDLDYCGIIYHIPSRQTQVGVTLNALMEKTERIQYQAALAITGA